MSFLAKPHAALLCEARSFYFRNRVCVSGAVSDFPAKKNAQKIA
jgi:hypothetical protein